MHALVVCVSVGAIYGVVVMCVCLVWFVYQTVMHDMLYVCMHVHFFTVTFFWTLKLNNAMDTKVCSPHISLLCSFSKMARAMQMPG